MLSHCAAVLSRLPLAVHYGLADWVLFPLIYHVVRYRRRLVATNLQNAFPDKTEAERRQIARDFYHQFCYTTVESIYGYRCPDEQMRQRVVFENMEEVNRLIDAAGGGIFMLGHMGNWEWLASIQLWVSPGVKELNVYRRLKSESMDKLMLMLRAKRGGACVEKRPVTIGLLSDQKPRPEVTRTWLRFLNQETGFLDGGEVLGKKFGYPVFYLHVIREQRGYYRIQMKTLSAEPKTSAEGEITTAYARALEGNINEQPFLWLWTHDRFKWKRA